MITNPRSAIYTEGIIQNRDIEERSACCDLMWV